ncbi:hypothetical protein D7V64_00715 [Acinetobacter cumulans]|uniref:Uncharacterized protein n=1 Tax=Acinetobacter cumulans TaxID=2136182 RepID=A0A3A8GKS1_9GAMM|nr:MULTISPECIES: hypothetical protein [Acinetobacter]RFS31341.1 hypothetical protein DYI81_08430 [Acinetobacter sp. SWAC5]RKG42262.1 hypothetical protein D7V51_12235 [Acinetobacter cumulans]RKG55664.1 hypothetical protein D7V64_00715 [Acinetobacter cumulans]RLL35296.1 hypothetical protein D9K80_09120 [Acinetobacter cumulans]RLL43257.1 hypothetical protein D9K79_11100 [Acinetobacter cumulans]
MSFISAKEAKEFSTHANLNIEQYKIRLAQQIESNAKQGNTAVFTVLPKHLPLDQIRALSAELTQMGYQVRFEVNEFFYSLNVYWI